MTEATRLMDSASQYRCMRRCMLFTTPPECLQPSLARLRPNLDEFHLGVHHSTSHHHHHQALLPDSALSRMQHGSTKKKTIGNPSRMFNRRLPHDNHSNNGDPQHPRLRDQPKVRRSLKGRKGGARKNSAPSAPRSLPASSPPSSSLPSTSSRETKNRRRRNSNDSGSGSGSDNQSHGRLNRQLQLQHRPDVKMWESRRRDPRVNGADLYVARFTKNGLGPAKPCGRCLEWCRWAGVKRIFHWDPDAKPHGKWDVLKVNDPENAYLTHADVKINNGTFKAYAYSRI